MSAEKEIVNYWYNKKGLFTVNNIKTSNNRDCGILALRFDEDKVDEIIHAEVSCSITNNISETTNLDKSINKIIGEKFDNKDVQNTISGYIKPFSLAKQNIRKELVLVPVAKSRKAEIIRKFSENNVEVIEFDNILYDVLEKLDTQYYKNDIIRTLQLTKYLLLSEPTKLVKMLASDSFTPNLRNEFLSTVLNEDNLIKGFRKANTENVSIILKNASLKPSELAVMLGQEVLNRRTRKPFLNSLMEQENTRKITNNNKRIRKKVVSLENFF